MFNRKLPKRRDNDWIYLYLGTTCTLNPKSMKCYNVKQNQISSPSRTIHGKESTSTISERRAESWGLKSAAVLSGYQTNMSQCNQTLWHIDQHGGTPSRIEVKIHNHKKPYYRRVQESKDGLVNCRVSSKIGPVSFYSIVNIINSTVNIYLQYYNVKYLTDLMLNLLHIEYQAFWEEAIQHLSRKCPSTLRTNI